MWGDVFELRQAQREWPTEAADPCDMVGAHRGHAVALDEAVRNETCRFNERVCLRALRGYTDQHDDRRPQQLEAYVSRVLESGLPSGDGTVVSVTYYQKQGYG